MTKTASLKQKFKSLSARMTTWRENLTTVDQSLQQIIDIIRSATSASRLMISLRWLKKVLQGHYLLTAPTDKIKGDLALTMQPTMMSHSVIECKNKEALARTITINNNLQWAIKKSKTRKHTRKSTIQWETGQDLLKCLANRQAGTIKLIQKDLKSKQLQGKSLTDRNTRR